jgi:ribosome biogenesis GTPase A
MDIQWYPGHMAKAKKILKESLSMADVVIELLDARIPYSSKNPDMDKLIRGKKRIMLFNKCDLADKNITEEWVLCFKQKSYMVLKTVAKFNGDSIKDIKRLCIQIMQEKIENNRRRGLLVSPIRLMIVGIPNTGKSTLINGFAGRNVAKTENKPGVTKAQHWVKIGNEFEMLDTPGILWPKFEEKAVGLKLAITGAIKETLFDHVELANYAVKLLVYINKDSIIKRYGININDQDSSDMILHNIGQARNIFIREDVDEFRTAKMLLDDIKSGKLGKMSLETKDTVFKLKGMD